MCGVCTKEEIAEDEEQHRDLRMHLYMVVDDTGEARSELEVPHWAFVG
jgi:hypothetical protein